MRSQLHFYSATAGKTNGIWACLGNVIEEKNPNHYIYYYFEIAQVPVLVFNLLLSKAKIISKLSLSIINC